MATKYLTVDDVTGRYKRGGTVTTPREPVDEDYIIGAGGASEQALASPITSLQALDVFFNGQMKREGSSYDWLRSVALQKVTFGYSVPEGTWVRVRRYS